MEKGEEGFLFLFAVFRLIGFGRGVAFSNAIVRVKRNCGPNIGGLKGPTKWSFRHFSSLKPHIG